MVQQFISAEAVIELLAAVHGQTVETGVVGTAVAAGSNILDGRGKSWPVDAFRSLIVDVYEGPGSHQARIILGNSPNALVIVTTWERAIAVGAKFKVKAPVDLRPALRDVLGGGLDISGTNPLPVDTSPGVKAATVVLNEATIAAATTTVPGDCANIDLSGGPGTLAITVEATYNVAAAVGIRIHVRASYDGVNFDTEDWDTWDAGFTAGATIRQTEHYDTDPMHVRVLVENLDAAQAVTGVRIIATVGP